jgi:serine/threonine protein kinase
MRLGDWVVEEEIGRGAMGRVYRAHAAGRPGRRAAVKVLDEQLARDPAFRERFEAESDILRKLQHANIVGFLDAGLQGETPYLVMEYVEGGNCETLLREHRRLPWPDVLAVGLQVAAALKHAHSRGVIHRDLKPSNLLYAADAGRWNVAGGATAEPVPRIKLSDFGIAKLFPRPADEPTVTVVGSMAYLSPEQAAGKPASKRSDLYALGGVLYTLLAGRPPHVGTSPVELIHKHCFVQPEALNHLVPDKMPHELEHLVMRLLSKDPKLRFGDGGELMREMERLQGKLERKGLMLRTSPDLGQQETPVNMVGMTATTHPPLKPVSIPVPKPNRRPFRPWHNRPLVLVPAFLVVVGLIVWGLVFSKPGPEELFAKAQPLLASDNPADWEKAWFDYLEPMSRRYPDRHADVVEAVKAKVEDRAAQRRAVAQGRAAKPMTEAERYYQQGLRHCQAGDWPAARRAWEDVARAFDGVESEQRWVQLARQGLATLDAPDAQLRRPVRHPEQAGAALERIKRLRAEGKTAEADAARAALLDLYRGDPSADDIRATIEQEPAGDKKTEED